MSAIQILHFFYPFADAKKSDDLLPAGTEDYIHIRIQQKGTWVYQWLSGHLWLRLRSQGFGIKSHLRLPSGSLPLPLPTYVSASLCVSLMNK